MTQISIQQLISCLNQQDDLESALARISKAIVIDFADADELNNLANLVGLKTRPTSIGDLRLYIKLQIAINTSTGTAPELIAIYKQLLGTDTAKIVEVPPFGIKLLADTEDLTEYYASIILDFIGKAAGQCVKVFGIEDVPRDGMFVLGEDDATPGLLSTGLDAGGLGRLYT